MASDTPQSEFPSMDVGGTARESVLIAPDGTECLPINGRVDRASATEAVDSGSIPDRVKPKTIKSGIYSFPA